ncbi:SDR family oxidoreductase [Noviherbaspirillum pedocola]|uniref:SDR family oxidoreductase n=1 Tax=Noviherbaspirillum pedocola TaxID=2801341 RepID=A0A934SY93_9BURK|nr:SDR family oxidoreductase [Noviherbaspirillum pedocola]MBK4733943.1 SDR family oxidoreductase [Noviherbaspirillum pedocola]
MRAQLKPLSEQVIVITGATSGIGLATAREAARRGAKLVLVARDERALSALGDELRQRQCEALAIAADVGDEAAVQRVSADAIARFGHYDTWVNNAGVSIYGRLDDATMAENRRLFDTNFWGVVHGALAARRHLRGHGGAIITVGSVASDLSLPLQGMYSASKHAVKGFIDALRVESDNEGAPVSITLIKPASVSTMLTEHARNYLPQKPALPPPVYAPKVVADAILHAAAHPVRDVYVGEPSVAGSTFMSIAPGMTDKLLQTFVINMQQRREAEDRPDNGNLFKPAEHGVLRESPEDSGFTLRHSPYTEVMTRWNGTMDFLLRGFGR